MDVSYIGSRSSASGRSPGNSSEVNYVPLEYLALGNLLFQPINSAAAAAAGFTEPFPGFANQLGANTVAQALKPYPQYTIGDRGQRAADGRGRALRLVPGARQQAILARPDPWCRSSPR